MSSQDMTASPKTKARASLTEATPSPKERRQSFQQSHPVVGDERDHAEAAPRQRSTVVFETDGLGIVDPIQKSPLALEELTPTSTADVDTPSKLEQSDGFHDDNDDEDYTHEEADMKEAPGVAEQRDVVAEQSDVPLQADGDDDYNDDGVVEQQGVVAEQNDVPVQADGDDDYNNDGVVAQQDVVTEQNGVPVEADGDDAEGDDDYSLDGVVEQRQVAAEQSEVPAQADGDDDYNEDGVVEQQDVVAEQNDVPTHADGDDDYNDDYNSDAQDGNGESKQAALDDYLEECF